MVSVEAVVEFDYAAQEPDELTIKKGDIITHITIQPGGWWEGLLVRENRRGMFPDNFVKVMGDTHNQVVMRKKPGRKCIVLFSYQPANADELELHVNDIIDVISEVEEGWWKGKLNNKIGVFPSNFVEEIMETREAVNRNINNNNNEPKVNDISKTSSIVDVMPPEDPPPPLPVDNNSDSVDIVESTSSTLAPNLNIITTTTTTIINSTDLPLPSLPPKPVKEYCKVLYAYNAANDDELTLKEDDIILLISKEAPDKGWWKGELNGKVGVFPDNFVTVLNANDESIKSEKPSSNKTTTNRIRDSITKSNETTAALRKSLDLSPKKEDPPPISVNKKPPPPIKKPLRSPTIGPTSPSPSKHNMKFSLPFSSTNTSVDTNSTTVSSSESHNKTQISIPSTPGVEDTPKRLSISSVCSDGSNTTSDNLDGSCISKNSSYNVTNVSCNSISSPGSAISNHSSISLDNSVNRRTSGGGQSSDSDFEGLDKPAKLTHLTANRAKAPRRRPPSASISKEDSLEVNNLVNGSAEPHVIESVVAKVSPTPKVPWVEELKMNQAKKSAAQGKTRVTIGPFTSTTTIPEATNANNIPSSTSSSTTVVTTSTASSKSSTVVFRNQRPASMFASEVTTVTPSLVRNNSISSCNKPPLPSSTTSPHPSAPPTPSHVPSSNTNASGDITLSAKQFNELIEKVNKLEGIIETQSVLINELNKKMKNSQDKQAAMHNEMEKLMDLVTQV